MKYIINIHKVMLLVCLLLPGLPAASPGDTAPATSNKKPLIFGLLPSESPVSKFKRYSGIRNYLSQQLQREVIMETAKDFPEFLRRTGQRRYDFLITAPHFVVAAVDSGKYEVLTTITTLMAAQIVVHQNSPIQQASELYGKKVATPPIQAIITLAGQHFLEQQGLAGKDKAHYIRMPSHNSAYEAVLGGQADAAIISTNILRKARNKKEPLRVIASSKKLPNVAIMAATNLPASFRKKLQAILAGMKDSEQGKAILKKASYPGYRITTSEEFEPLRPYLELANKLTPKN